MLLSALLKVVKITFLTALILIIWIIASIYRKIVSILIKLWAEGITEIVATRDAFFTVAADANASIVITSVVQKGVSLQNVVERYESLVNKMSGESGRLKYWKLQHHITKWMGYSFWKREKAFKICQHVQDVYVDGDGKLCLDPSPKNLGAVSSTLLKSVEKEVMNRPFVKGLSPWHFWILRNVLFDGQLQDVYFLKCHHAIGDGYSLMKLLVLELCCEPLDKLILPKPSPFSFYMDFLAIIMAPFSLAALILEEEAKDPLRPQSKEQLQGNGGFHLVECKEKLGIETFKRLRAKHGKNLNTKIDHLSIVLEGISFALRGYLRGKGGELKGGEVVNAATPFPFPGHPDDLGNYWSDMTAGLPIGMNTAVCRLGHIQENLDKFKSSMDALTSFKLQPILGSLPNPFMEGIMEQGTFSVVASDFPGPKVPVHLFGKKLLDVHFVLGFGPGTIGYIFYSTSYCGKWKLNVLVDQGLMTREEDAQNLADSITNYLLNLDLKQK